MKISSNLFISMSLLVIIGILISVPTYYIASEHSLEQRIRAQLESVSIIKKNQIYNFMAGRRNNLEGIAKERLFAEAYSKSLAAGDGPEQSKANGTGILGQLLEERLISNKEFSEIFIIDMHGKVYASTDPKQVGKFKTSNPYYLQGKKETFVQYFYYSYSLQKLALTVSTPIRDSGGQVIGILAGRIDLGMISEIMTERSGLGETGETYLVNKFNLVVSELRHEEGAALTKLILTEGVKDCLAGNENFGFYANYQKKPVAGYYVWIPEGEICLLAEIWTDEAMAPLRMILSAILWASCGILILTGVMAFLLSSRITAPITDLMDAVNKISDGDLDVKIKVKSKNEIGELASNFTQMMAELKKSRKDLEKINDELERKVHKRTEELRTKISQLERFNRIVVGRELKMIELKKKISELEDKKTMKQRVHRK
jgi:HAMP domain-containing protein